MTTQGEVLAGLLAAEGYWVITASGIPNRVGRVADIVRTLSRNRRSIDLLVLQVYSGPSFVIESLSSGLARRFGIPIVMHLHGGAMTEFIARHPGWTKKVLSRARALIAPSEFLARAVSQIGMRAQIIPNVLDIDAYPYRHRSRLKPRLFWMRTFHPMYNPEMALRALAGVRESVPDACMVMGGQEKGHGANTRRLAGELSLSDCVRFAGFLGMADKTREGAAADIFLNTNHIDNMPVSVIEACAMGLPVVATAVGGVPDLLTNGETALLVPDDDACSMATGIVRLLRDSELASRLSANGRALAEQCSWESVRPLWTELFANTAAARSHGGPG